MKYKITIETPEETFLMSSNHIDSISRYANAVAECINRDLDGDETIDDNFVPWAILSDCGYK